MTITCELSPLVHRDSPMMTADDAAILQRLGAIYRFGVPDLSSAPQPVEPRRG